MAGGDLAAERFPDAGEMLLGSHARDDWRAAGGQFIENGNVEVTIESERERARDGRGGEDENVRGVAVGGGFVHQAFALEDAEAVLLVNGDEAEAGEGDVVFDERMGADDELGFAGADALEDGGFFGGFQAADEEVDAIASFGEDAARGKKMLDGKNFGGGHEGRLSAVFDGDNRGLQRDDGFAAADVTLEEAVHRGGLFEVGGDFGEDAFLRGGGLEREDAYQSLADGVFAKAEGDGVFLASGLAIESEAELIEEKFLEDEALLCWGTKSVQGVERFTGLGEMGVMKCFTACGIVEAFAQGLRQNVGHARIDELDGGVHGAANLAGAESADSFIDGNDAADFDLRIDHLDARGAELVDFGFTVEDEKLAGL